MGFFVLMFKLERGGGGRGVGGRQHLAQPRAPCKLNAALKNSTLTQKIQCRIPKEIERGLKQQQG